MRTRGPHPVFIICVIVALLGALGAAVNAIGASNCDGTNTYRPDNPCNAKHQVLEDSSVAIALSSLVVAIVGVGFQIGRSGPSVPPPLPQFPGTAGPPHPGMTPPPRRPQPGQERA